ncbi:Hercynylcysteine sulfoxide lyase [Lachnellula suecica]|uniref:Hercynylcysteine sulfoxide lyase n=1 Tax=Lachnellula suecica TaxID=602035 RepID=A0A8T9CA32_9HELO|nr:Hercynylcysteine sulfoxide lyase [Lachnellula suecica]
MTLTLDTKMGEAPLNDTTYERTPFGKEMLKHFSFDPAFKNLNHGSFGTAPRVIREKQRAYQDQCEAQPDPFIRFTYPKKLDENRAAIAKLLNAPLESIVFVPNATTGVNAILRSIAWHEDGRDEILYFNTIYGACGKTIEYVAEINRNLVQPREITTTYPISDADLLASFRAAIKASRAARKVPRLALFDTVSSMPGLRAPFEQLTKICKEEGILSLIDGAHGVGHVPLDLTALDCDFFTSNAHKWLFVPRGCAVLYVPVKNQEIVRSSLPTSHGFQPRTSGGGTPSTLPPAANSEFVNNFEFVGTIDNTNYLVVGEAIKWREEVCGGEKAIMEYNSNLAREAGQAVAKILGTKVLDNDEHTLTDCCLVNVLLPMEVSESAIQGTTTVKPAHTSKVTLWLQTTLIDEFKTFLAISFFQGQWWVRLSGQVYLDITDFEWAGEKLKEICERIGKEEFLTGKK